MPFSSYIQQYTGSSPSQALASHQNGSSRPQRSFGEVLEHFSHYPYGPELPIDRHGLSSHAKKIVERNSTSKPYPEFPRGKPGLEYQIFPCTRTWGPASPVDTWPWPPKISVAFLEGDLGWNNRSFAYPRCIIKVNIQRDDLIEWFQKETKIATASVVPNEMPIAPNTIRGAPSDASETKDVRNKYTIPDIALSNLNNKPQEALRSLLPSANIERTQKAIEKAGKETKEKGEEEKEDDWEEMNEDDIEGPWEMVDRNPTNCGDELWFGGFPQKRPGQKRMLSVGGA